MVLRVGQVSPSGLVVKGCVPRIANILLERKTRIREVLQETDHVCHKINVNLKIKKCVFDSATRSFVDITSFSR